MMEPAQEAGQDPAQQSTGELERSFDVDKLLELPQGRFRIETSAQEREALAQRARLDGVNALSANLRIAPDGKGVHVWGTLKGEVSYICGVSLEPFAAPVSSDIDLFFQPVAREKGRRQKAREAAREHDRSLRAQTASGFRRDRDGGAQQAVKGAAKAAGKVAGKAAGKAGERIEDIDPLSDPPEPMHDGQIELGELLSEYFVLALDPFPRKPGVNFDPGAIDPETAGEQAENAARKSPFAALAGLARPKPEK